VLGQENERGYVHRHKTGEGGGGAGGRREEEWDNKSMGGMQDCKIQFLSEY